MFTRYRQRPVGPDTIEPAGGRVPKGAPAMRVAAAALMVLVFAAGCRDEEGYQKVDFSSLPEPAAPAAEIRVGDSLHVAIAAMVSPKETLARYRELLDYIGKRVDRRIQPVQRKTYREVNALFADGKLDVAFICSGPYSKGKTDIGFEALVTPVVRGEPFYQAYLIVGKDSPVAGFEQLRGRRFAFTDPDSNTGALVPAYWLSRIGETPDTFFASYTYTYSHDNSIMAVAKSLVDAATVDGHIWEYYNTRNPVYTSRTRVIDRSIKFGSPPLVVSERLSADLKQGIRSALLLMHTEEAGRRILDSLMIDRFVDSEDSWYAPVQMLQRQLSAAREAP